MVVHIGLIYKDYETILRLIENKPQIIVQHCSENEEAENQSKGRWYRLADVGLRNDHNSLYRVLIGGHWGQKPCRVPQ